MKLSKITFIAGVLLIHPIHLTHAQDARAHIAAKAQDCPMVETANLSFNFNGTETDISKIKLLTDKKMEEVKAIAVEAKAGELEIQNYSYNVYNNGNASTCEEDVLTDKIFQYNSSFSFTVKPGGKPAELAALLTSKGYNVSLNVNSYKQCQ
jgi:hypothetical protein